MKNGLTKHLLARGLPKRLAWGFRKLSPFGSQASPGERKVRFQCNICGGANTVPAAALQREVPSCARCGSTVRTRAIVHLLTTELFGRSITIPELPRRADLAGIGLSDSEHYAKRLGEKLDYTNTFFHREPRLDITAPADDLTGRYDFIIASDVFEHVAPPVARSFANARRLLKPQGVLIFSVPYSLEAETREHFPELNDYRLVERDGEWCLENRTVDGRKQVFTDLHFHGGPGSTLEMRLFSRSGLIRDFAAARFAGVRIADEAYPAYGIVWPEPWSVPMVAYATLGRLPSYWVDAGSATETRTAIPDRTIGQKS
jgi:SAM-dependent methyltransferase